MYQTFRSSETSIRTTRNTVVRSHQFLKPAVVGQKGVQHQLVSIWNIHSWIALLYFGKEEITEELLLRDDSLPELGFVSRRSDAGCHVIGKIDQSSRTPFGFLPEHLQHFEGHSARLRVLELGVKEEGVGEGHGGAMMMKEDSEALLDQRLVEVREQRALRTLGFAG